jgi:hypothetical protein
VPLLSPDRGSGPEEGAYRNGNDVLGEELDLALLLLPRHEALIEGPAEPLEVALTADLA